MFVFLFILWSFGIVVSERLLRGWREAVPIYDVLSLSLRCRQISKLRISTAVFPDPHLKNATLSTYSIPYCTFSLKQWARQWAPHGECSHWAKLPQCESRNGTLGFFLATCFKTIKHLKVPGFTINVRLLGPGTQHKVMTNPRCTLNASEAPFRWLCYMS